MTVALVLHRAGGAPASTSFRRAAFGKEDPFARHREIAWQGPDAMIAGRIRFIGELEVASFPHIETIVVVEGELTLAAPGAAPLVIGPQSGAVVGCGTALRILAASRVQLVFCAAACRRRLQAVGNAAGRRAPGPGAAMPQRQRLQRRRCDVPRGNLGFDTVPPDCSPASRERIHVSVGRQRAVRSSGWQRVGGGRRRRAFCAAGRSGWMGEQRSRREVLRGSKRKGLNRPS
jgi:hypothetical protein